MQHERGAQPRARRRDTSRLTVASPASRATPRAQTRLLRASYPTAAPPRDPARRRYARRGTNVPGTNANAQREKPPLRKRNAAHKQKDRKERDVI